jgi:hypothetical protein
MAKKPAKRKTDGRSVKSKAHREKISKALKAYHAGKGKASGKAKSRKKHDYTKEAGYKLYLKTIGAAAVKKLGPEGLRKAYARHGYNFRASAYHNSKSNVGKKHKVGEAYHKAKNKARSWDNHTAAERNKILTKHYGPMRGFSQEQKRAMWRDVPPRLKSKKK